MKIKNLSLFQNICYQKMHFQHFDDKYQFSRKKKVLYFVYFYFKTVPIVSIGF